jgi:preprotein translocase subunit YajC
MTVPVAASLIALQAPSNQIASMVFMYGAIFAIFYFVLIRPQQKQRKAQDDLVRALKKGDEVVTAGGIIGEVLHIATKDTVSMEDRITIKSADSRLIVERGRILRVLTAPTASA